MFERRASRFAVEVVILVAIAFSLTIAHLQRLAIAGAMLLGWLVVSVLEWATLRNEAHFGHGLPPRYYVPEIHLPAPLRREEVVQAHGGWPVSEPRIELIPYVPAAPTVELPAVPVAQVADQSWLVEALPGSLDEDTAAEVESAPTLEIVPELAPYSPEPIAEARPEPVLEEPAAEVETFEPETEPDVEVEPEIPAPAPVNWFDRQLPGVPPPREPDAEELPAWALLDPESDAEREDELAAESTLAEELEPLLDVHPADEPDRHDLGVPVGEPLHDIPSADAWFDAPLTAPVETPAAPTPTPTSYFPRPDLEFDLLVERLAGEVLGDTSLVTWFDAKLPGELPETGTASSGTQVLDRPDAQGASVGGWPVERVERTEAVVADARTPGPSVATSRHSIDPFASAGASKGRLWGRERAEEAGGGQSIVEVPAHPIGRRLLPGRSKRDT